MHTWVDVPVELRAGDAVKFEVATGNHVQAPTGRGRGCRLSCALFVTRQVQVSSDDRWRRGEVLVKHLRCVLWRDAGPGLRDRAKGTKRAAPAPAAEKRTRTGKV